MSWPPEPDEATTWTTVRTYGGEPVAVREVRLWGELVRVDADGLVLCPGCLRMVTTADLARPDNPHPIGLPRQGGTLIGPMRPDRPEPPEPSVRDLKW
jgi:hypothetical protein